MTSPSPEKLNQLRAKIDAVDESIHTLLLQRASVIDELILAKGANTTKGAAFRPGREAQMMDVLSARHCGSIPMSMIVHIWREIISTFTWLQAGYRVHICGNDGPVIRDMARFQFGFTVAMIAHETIDDAKAAARGDGNGIVVAPAANAALWGSDLGGDTGLYIMARLPILDLPFDTVDAFVLAPALSDPVPFEMRAYTARLPKGYDMAKLGTCDVITQTPSADGSSAIMFAMAANGHAPKDVLDIKAVGGYFAALDHTPSFTPQFAPK